MSTSDHQQWMQQALTLAHEAEAQNEVPVGCVIVMNGDVIGQGSNRPVDSHDPSAHAEIIALREAGETLQNYRITNADLYVTLEPCIMCAGAITHARIARIIIGALDPKAGAAGSVFEILGFDNLNHKVEVISGIMEQECSSLLTGFFKQRRLEK